MISFEFHLKNRHEKTQKPLWFLGFQPRYLFRCYLLARSTEKDITGFFEKAAYGKAFSAFLLSPLGACNCLCSSMSIFIENAFFVREHSLRFVRGLRSQFLIFVYGSILQSIVQKNLQHLNDVMSKIPVVFHQIFHLGKMFSIPL